jgi:phosphopantetheine--protein transferase-like protein
MTETVAGCGIDIEELIRFRAQKLLKEGVDGFSEMVYTVDEIRNNLKSASDIKFPLCFSCKEAFFKALGVSWMNSNISWKDIELLFPDEKDVLNYNVRLSGYARELYEKKRCRRFETHLEYNDEFVVVQVVLFS